MRRFAFLPALAMLSACSGGGGLPSTATHLTGRTDIVSSQGRTKIKHVVVVIQENRTLDNLFHGFPGADTASSGITHTGQAVPLTPGPLEEPYDLGHSHANFETEYDGGKNDGFDEVPTSPQSTSTAPYQYVYQSEVQPYFDIAHQFVLGDHMFASQNGPSFPGHEYLIAGQAAGADDDPSDLEPWGCDAPPGTTVPVYNSDGSSTNVFPCFDYQTLGDLLDSANLSWRYYTTAGTQLTLEMMPDPYDAVRHIRFGPDWTADTVTPSMQILNDIAAGNLASVSWVNSPADASDHPQLNDGRGPSWVASIVNAIGQSRYYDDTVVLVTWDDWGGWYDHVVPNEYGVLGRGFRVPLLVVSKWSRHGYVSKTSHEFGSILRFIETVFDLPSLGTRDAASDDLADCFDFTQNPPAFTPIALNVPLNISTLATDRRANDNY
jgi:phospholipase C